MKLTIIIPMYNVEKYLHKCVNSCLNQKCKKDDYEIILVNDGSPDKSQEIAEAYSEKHSNVRVLNEENMGLSGARNNGLLHANGEYVWFVDADDYIEDGCLVEILSLLRDNLDILQLQARLVYDDKSLNKDFFTQKIQGIKCGKDLLLSGGLSPEAPFSIYRKAFLMENSLFFTKGIYHEDSEFKPKVTYYADKVASYDKVAYNYYQRQSGSITSTFSFKRAKDLIYVNNSLYDFSRKFEQEMIIAFNANIAMNMNSLFFDNKTLSRSDKKQLLKLVSENMHLVKCMFNTNSLKYKFESILMQINIDLFFALFVFFRKKDHGK